MNRSIRRANLCIVILLTLTALLAACGGSSTSAPTPTSSARSASVAGTFAVNGKQVSGISTAGFGLVSNGQRIIAYLCDGTPPPITIVQWFKGPVTSNAITVTNPSGAQLVAMLTAQRVTGTITLRDRRRFSFQAPLISGTSPASPNGDVPGLYRTETTFGGVRYIAGTVISLPTASASTVSVADLAEAVGLVKTIQTGPGSIINEQTGAVRTLPEPAHGLRDGAQVPVPGLGVFTLHRAVPGL